MLLLILWYVGPPSIASNFTDVKAEKQALSVGCLQALHWRYLDQFTNAGFSSLVPCPQASLPRHSQWTDSLIQIYKCVWRAWSVLAHTCCFFGLRLGFPGSGLSLGFA